MMRYGLYRSHEAYLSPQLAPSLVQSRLGLHFAPSLCRRPDTSNPTDTVSTPDISEG